MPAKILVTVNIESNYILVATPRCPRERPYCYSDKTRLFRTVKRCPDFVCLHTNYHLPLVVCDAADEEDLFYSDLAIRIGQFLYNHRSHIDRAAAGQDDLPITKEDHRVKSSTG